MRRFLLPPEAFGEDAVILTGDLYHHAAKVLRLKKGTKILLADGKGREFTGIIGEVGKTQIVVSLEGQLQPAASETGPKITIYQGLPKGNKIDLILQKCTELGAAAIVPFVADRSITRVAKDLREERVGRWQRIAHEAARQSRRTTVPEVTVALSLAEVLASSCQTVKFLLWEEEQAATLKKTLAELQAPPDIAVLIGPEGGFSSSEVAQARASGFISLTLGKRIIRTETAGFVILAILQFYWGDVG